jgi:hypothetical protein
MDHPVTIRTRLEPGDLGYIAYMHGSVYAEECGYGLHFEGYVLEGLHEFAAAYDPSRDRVWICEHEKKKVGFLVGVHRGDTLICGPPTSSRPPSRCMSGMGFI